MPQNAQPSTSGTDSQTQRAYQELERRIVALELAPGEIVSEKLLATALKMGRTPVREALRELAREGLVLILPQRGIIISDLDVSKQLRLIDFRRSLFKYIAEAAVRRGEQEQQSRCVAISDGLRAAITAFDRERIYNLADRLTETLLAMARNEYASAALQLGDGLARRFWRAHSRGKGDVVDVAQGYADLAGALGAQDADAALRAIDRLHEAKAGLARNALEND
ncbi:MAG: GntR family transcriptional regulator [Neomegalonema sp.]|nr:GntR family transcriptional regulator [Neomegalonema sp.]